MNALWLFVLLLAKFSSSQDWQGILIAGGNDERYVSTPYFQIVNPHTNIQKTISMSYDVPELFSMAAAVFDDGSSYKIYFTGGHTSEMEAVKSVVLFVHSPTKNQVSKVSNMTIERGIHTAVSLDNFIYACGGMAQDYEELSSCEKYDCVSDKWTPIESMHAKRWGHASVAYNNKIYVFGGRNGMPMSINVLNSTEIYDPVENKWTVGAQMPTPKISLRAIVVQDKIYLCGGSIDAENPVNTCYVYDPATNRYAVAPSMAKARLGHHMIALGEKIYIIGGKIGQHRLTDSIEEYDIVNGRSTVIKMKIDGARFYFSAAAVKA